MSELRTIDTYMKEMGSLIKARKSNSKEFKLLLDKIQEEALLLSPVERSHVLDRFFLMWDRKN